MRRVSPHPRALIEAVSASGHTSFDDRVKSYAGRHDGFLVAAPLSEKSLFKVISEPTRQAGQRGLGWYLDYLMSQERLDIFARTDIIWIMYHKSISPELLAISEALQKQHGMYTERTRELNGAGTSVSSGAKPKQTVNPALDSTMVTGGGESSGTQHHAFGSNSDADLTPKRRVTKGQLYVFDDWPDLKEFNEAAGISCQKIVTSVAQYVRNFEASMQRIFEGQVNDVIMRGGDTAPSGQKLQLNEAGFIRYPSHVYERMRGGSESQVSIVHGSAVDAESLRDSDRVEVDRVDGVSPAEDSHQSARESSLALADIPKFTDARVMESFVHLLGMKVTPLTPANLERTSQRMANAAEQVTFTASMVKGIEDALVIIKAFREDIQSQLQRMVGEAQHNLTALSAELKTYDQIAGGVYYDALGFTHGVSATAEGGVFKEAEGSESYSGFEAALAHLSQVDSKSHHASQPHRTKYTLIVMQELHAHIIALVAGLSDGDNYQAVQVPMEIKATLDSLGSPKSRAVRIEDVTGKPEGQISEADQRQRPIDKAEITAQCILYGTIDGAQLFDKSEVLGDEDSCKKPNEFGKEVIEKLIERVRNDKATKPK